MATRCPHCPLPALGSERWPEGAPGLLLWAGQLQTRGCLGAHGAGRGDTPPQPAGDVGVVCSWQWVAPSWWRPGRHQVRAHRTLQKRPKHPARLRSACPRGCLHRLHGQARDGHGTLERALGWGEDP